MTDAGTIRESAAALANASATRTEKTMPQPEGVDLERVAITNTELEAICKNAYVAGWNASQNFNHIGVDEGWKSWLEYVAQTGGATQ